MSGLPYANSESEKAECGSKKYSRCSKSPTNLNVSPDFHEPRILQWIDKRRNEAMTRFKLVGAAAILSMMVAPPVFAQAAIQEPGAFAFYHPNADVLNGGRPTAAAAS